MDSTELDHKSSRTRWILALIFGLALESCLVIGAIAVVMASKGIPLSLNGQGGTPLAIRPATSSSAPTAGAGTQKPKATRPASPAAIQTTTQEASSTPPELPTWVTPPPGKIVYVCFDGKFDQICLMNADGTNQKKLTSDAATNFYPSLSADGTQIVYSSRRTGNFEIFSMDLNGKNQQQLTDHIGNLYAPEISPKGNRIIFTAEAGNKQATWVMRIDGGNPHPLNDTEGGGIDPSWSPDGSQISFVSNRDGPNQLYVMEADGSNQRLIMRAGDLKLGGRNSWSPDGQWITFYAGPDGNHNIYIVNANGKDVRQITNGGDNLGPSWSPDGQWITFTSFRDGNNEVYVMRTDGSEATRLTFSKQSDWQPRWGK
ncbi:MAG TPA: DUF5050 domain-containing protein [Anaerolineales bacterium]